MDPLADTIRREEEKKRFLEDLKDASANRIATMLAERLFKIEDFQETQNHNSTEALAKTSELGKKFEIRQIYQRIMAVAMVVLLAETAPLSGLIGHVLRAILGMP